MRLIDADLLIEFIQATLNTGREDFPADVFREAVEEQPTAFDVDKVVEQLEELKEEDVCTNMSCVLCKYNSECFPDEYADQKVVIDRAIEIVKEGRNW